MKKYSLKNKNGLIAQITDFGATLVELWIPDRNGVTSNVVLGFENLADYADKSPHFGATTGRFANRIAGGKCMIAGKTYNFPLNDHGKNTLHGGPKALDKRMWNVDAQNESSLKFSYASPDMDEGFPGNLQIAVTYSLSDNNELKIEYAAQSDKPTIINFTNHSYFNLSGAGNGTVLDHLLTLTADKYTPVDDAMIPTGAIESVKGTPYDFTTTKRIGQDIDRVQPGYDINYVLNNTSAQLVLAANATDPKSGRKMEMFTTEPGVQLYTGNFLESPINGFKGPFPKYGAFCLEAQHFPDSPHHPNFPSTEYGPNRPYQQTTIYKFSID